MSAEMEHIVWCIPQHTALSCPTRDFASAPANSPLKSVIKPNQQKELASL